MSEIETFVLADRALNAVIQQITDDQWNMTTPEWFQLGGDQTVLTVRKLINYHAFDELWIPDTLAGKPADDATMPARDVDHLGDDPKAKFADLAEAGIAAVQAITDLDANVHLSYGDWPTRDYLMHITSFRGFRSYDIAKMLGLDTTMSDELVQALWDELAPHFDEWRQWGVYRPAIEVPADASLQDRLLAGSGRDPR